MLIFMVPKYAANIEVFSIYMYLYNFRPQIQENGHVIANPLSGPH